MKRTIIIFSSLMYLAVSSLAETNNPAASKRIPDFGSGLKKFEALGLPSVTGGEYVELSLHNYPSTITRYHGVPEFKGNAWLMSSNDVSPAELIYNERPIEVTKIDFTGYGRQTNDMIMGDWENVSLEKDVTILQKYIDTKAEDSYDWSFNSMRGNFLLFALHVYQSGLTNEANRLINSMMQRSSDPRDLLSAGVNELANSQYESLLEAFYKTQDSQVFADGLKDILSRFSSGWESGPGVVVLLSRIQEKLATTNGVCESFTEDQKALVSELCTAGEYKSHALENIPFWQYGTTMPTTPHRHMQGDTNHPIYAVMSMGLDGTPFLLNLLECDELTTIPLNSLSSMRSHISGNSLSDEEIFQKGISRPAMLSDVARAILLPIQPVEDAWDAHNLSNDIIAQNTADWYELFKDKTPRDIAMSHLENGNDTQREKSMKWLVTNMQSNDFSTIETYLLEMDADDYGGRELVGLYIAERGADAADFVEQYISHIENAPEDDDETFVIEGQTMEEYKSSEKRMEQQYIQQLRSIVSRKPLDELMADIAAGRESLSDHHAGLQMRLSKMDQDEATALILKTATDSKSPLQKIFLISMINTLNAQNYMGEKAPDPIDFQQHLDQWQALFNSISNNLYAQMAIATQIESALSEDTENRWDVFRISTASIHLDAPDPLLLRIQERLAGKTNEELTPFPSATNLSEEAIKAKLAELEALDDEALKQALPQLSYDEFIALTVFLPTVQERVKELAKRTAYVSGLSVTTSDGNIPPEIAALKGRAINADLINELKSYARKTAKDGKAVIFSLYKMGECPAGYVLYYVQTSPEEYKAYPYMGYAAESEEFRAEGYTTERINTGDQSVELTTPLTVIKTEETEAVPEQEENMDLMDEVFDDLADASSEEKENDQKTYKEMLDKLQTSETPWELKHYNIFAIPALTESPEAGETDHE